MLRRAEQKSEVRDRKKQELKEEELRQELRECTFTPSIKYTVPKSKVHFPLHYTTQHITCVQRPVAIRGIGRYLELQHNAQRLKQEQEQRSKKAFNLNPKGNRSKFTIPVPFTLSKAPITS